MLTLAGYLENKGYDNETIRQTVTLWEWNLPLQNRQIEKDCYDWWNQEWGKFHKNRKE